ncbi:MAG: M20 family metallopeptidase [Pyrinomonadaceae bacterium]
MELSNSQLQLLNEYFVSRHDEIVASIKALVETESPSGDEAGSKAVVSMLASTAETIAGVKVEAVPVNNYGQHLRLTAFANAPESAPILLLGHTDTVHARGSIIERPWRVEGNKAYGPGVFDMKANCVVALEVIRALAQVGIQPNRSVTVLFTCDEETGSGSGRPLVEAEAKNASSVLVLEPSGSGGRAKTGRKGTGIYSLEAKGLAAHAGLEPEKGASAVLELARQTERLHAFNGKTGGISVNVGVFKGGTLSNVVAAEARAEIDVRFTTAGEAELIENEIFKLRPFDDRVQLTLTGGINRPPLERTEKVVELYERARMVARTLDFDLGETQVGGASDGNFAAAVGAAVLDGLGIEGDGAHAIHEHIILADIPRRGALIAGLIASL